MQQFQLQCGQPVGGLSLCVCVCSPRLNEAKHEAAQLDLGVDMAIGAEMITHSRAACSGSKYHAHHQRWQLSLSPSHCGGRAATAAAAQSQSRRDFGQYFKHASNAFPCGKRLKRKCNFGRCSSITVVYVCPHSHTHALTYICMYTNEPH